MNYRVGLGLCVAALVLSGCGGDDDKDGEKCGSSSGCGGDVVGTWKITSTCVEVDTTGMMGSMDCPGLSIGGSKVDMTGTVTYASGGTFESSLTTNGSVTINVPASCLMQQGQTVTCSQLQQAFEASEGTFESITCTGTSSCSCVAQLPTENQESSGTYTTSGTKLTQSVNGNDPETNDYCVKGTTLTISPSADSGTTGTITLTKQ